MLEIDAVDVYYGDLQALYQITLTVKDREIVAIIGSNGAGKSTLLRTICGLLRPTSGSMRFNGLDLAKEPVHRIVEAGVSMVQEEKKVFREMSVLENLEMGAFTGTARKVKDLTMRYIYEVFPVLKIRGSQKAGTLSGGEQQMVLVGRALMTKPKLLLIDELSLGLSPLLAQTLLKTITRIHQETDMSIMLVEQNVRKALEISDRGYVIENGRIVACDTAQTLLNSEGIKDAYFGISS